MAQLVRISVDLPNSLDDLWKITVDKTDAQLPAVLRRRLSQIVDGLRKRSSKAIRSKGGRIRSGSTIAVWNRYARNGEINYRINRDHPMIAALLRSDDDTEQANATAALLAIEQGFPVDSFSKDADSRPDDLHQTEAQADRFRDFLETAVPMVLAQEGGDFRRLEKRLRQTEPFCLNWKPVEEYLERKGWADARS